MTRLLPDAEIQHCQPLDITGGLNGYESLLIKTSAMLYRSMGRRRCPGFSSSILTTGSNPS